MLPFSTFCILSEQSPCTVITTFWVWGVIIKLAQISFTCYTISWIEDVPTAELSNCRIWLCLWSRTFTFSLTGSTAVSLVYLYCRHHHSSAVTVLLSKEQLSTNAVILWQSNNLRIHWWLVGRWLIQYGYTGQSVREQGSKVWNEIYVRVTWI